MIAFSFVHPAILGGLALASLPIIIHLLNRRRFKTMEWAAMDFLLKAAVRNRRRVRLENLLLLILRTLLVVVLILAVARPFTEKQDAFAAMFGATGSTERVFLLDDSHSMRAGTGNRSAFESAKQLVRRIVTRLHDERSADKVTIVLASRPRAGGEGFVRVAAASATSRRLLQRLDELRPTDCSLDAAAAIDAVRDAYTEEKARVVLHVVSDFRRRDWVDADDRARPDVVAALKRFTERGEVRLVDVGSNPVQNLGVVGLRPEDRAVVAGVPAVFVATVKNFGPDPVAVRSLTFAFGDRVQPPVPVEGTLQPRQTQEIKAEYTFRAPGPVVVEARLLTDALPGDDVRRRTVEVRKSMRFLLVDGEPEMEDFRGETDFLAAALAPPGKVESGVEVEVVSEHAFAGRELEDYDGIFLCNVYRVPEEAVLRLEDFVRAGGGLVFFLGDQVDPQIYNASFFGRGEEAGEKLLPLLLRDVEGGTESYLNPAAPAPDHPVTQFLRGMNQIVFRTIAVSRYVKGELPGRGDGRVLLQYSDEAGSPMLAEKSYGDGRILLFTTAADLEWSNFPQSILYLAMLQESARYVVRPDTGAGTLTAGAPISIRYDPNIMGSAVAIVPPAEMGGAPVSLSPMKEGEDGPLTYRYDRTQLAGIYTARMRTREGEDIERPYALNVEASEGDLERAALERVRDAVPGARIERAGDDAAQDTDESDRTEFWRTLVYALIAVAAVETLLAWRFGHHAVRPVAAEGKQVFVR